MNSSRLKVIYYTPFYSGKIYPMFARMHDIWHYINRMKDPGFEYEILTAYGEHIDSEKVHVVFKRFKNLIRKSESFRRWMEKLVLPREVMRRDYNVFHSIYFDSVTVKLLKKIRKKRNGVKTVVGPNTIDYFKQRKGDRYDLSKMGLLKRWKSKKKYELMKKYLSSDLVDLHISVGKYHTRLLKEVGVDSNKVFELPPRVDPKYFSVDSEKNSGIDGVFKILYVGNFTKFKGVDVYLKALELLKRETDIDFKGILVGKGDYPISKHTSIKDDIEIVGYVDRASICKYYNEADVYVHPGIEEAGPSTIIESLACGTPYIATDRLAFREYDTQDVGKFFELGDAGEL
ncbi:MAG: glycosyltransferase family 4 protein, partial [Candidatus Saliniplasma sp.]